MNNRSVCPGPSVGRRNFLYAGWLAGAIMDSSRGGILFNIVLGILMAYLSNYFLSGIGENEWRWMLGVQAFPSLIFTITVMLIPESPRWLILQRGDVSTARTILHSIDKDAAEKIIVSSSRYTAAAPAACFASRPVSKRISRLPNFPLSITATAVLTS